MKRALRNNDTIQCMLRYKTETRPVLVALYDIRPGNGADQFLQPRSPHGAIRPRLSAVINGMLTSTSAVGHSACHGRPIGTKRALSHF